MWPVWLRKHVPPELTRHGSLNTLVHPDRRRIPVEKFRTGDALSRTVRVVCGPCNNGWMSRLQQETKPLLVPMLRGERITLRLKQQKLLTAWIAMTVMTGEFTEPNNTAISLADRQRLMRYGTLPTHWKIWIGRCSGLLDQPRWHHRVMTFAEDETKLPISEAPPVHNTQTTTIRLGEHLIIHVMSSHVAKRIIRLWPLPGAVAPALQQLFPHREKIVVWPTRQLLSGPDVLFLANRFFEQAALFLVRASLPGFDG